MSDYRSKESVDALLEEYQIMLQRLTYIATFVETEEGIFTFPDGYTVQTLVKNKEPV